MASSKANGRAPDTDEEKSVPTAVVNYPTDAVTDIEGTNSFTFNFAANTGPSFSQPFQPVEPHYVPGANEGPINAGQANTFTWPAFPPHAADGLHYPPGHFFGVDSRSPDALIQNRAEASTSKNLAYSLIPSTGDGHQCFNDPLLNNFAHLAPRSTFHDSNVFGTSSHLASSFSTGLAQPFDPIDKQTSQGPNYFDASDMFPQPSFGGSDYTNQSWTWSDHGPDSSNPRFRSTLPPTSTPTFTLGSDPFPQSITSATSQTPKSTSADDSFPSNWPCVGLAEDLQLQDPKRDYSSYEKEVAGLPNFPHITLQECICDEWSWLRQCPRLWEHHQSALVSTSTVCTCQGGVLGDVVPRNCPAAARHLVAMVHENHRIFADRYQDAAQRNPLDNNSLYVDSLLFAPSRLIDNPCGESTNPPFATTEGQKIPGSVLQLPSSALQLPSPIGQPPTNLPIQINDHAPSVHVRPPVSMMPEWCQPKPTRRKGDPDTESSSRTTLPSSEAPLTFPTLGGLTIPNHSRKRSVPDDPAVSNVIKKQKTDPLPESSEGLFYHKSGPKLQIRQRSDWLGMPSNGDQKRKRGKGKKKAKTKGKGEGKRKGKEESNDQPKEIIEATLPRLPYLDEVDRAFLDSALKTLRLAPFLSSPQEIECTVGKDGACDLDVIRSPRSTGIGQVQEGDSVYFVFLSQIEDKFLCWICGHKMTVEKQLRALCHVRSHFEHRPFHCNWSKKSEKGEEIPCGCGKSWASIEAMRDEHNKRSTLHECTHCPTPTPYSTPSNLARHIREMHPDRVEGSAA